MSEYITAWQCIGCGKLEAPQTCIGVCRDKKVLLVGKGDYDAALAEILKLHAQLDPASSMLLRFECATPREGQWRRAYQALQEQVREVRAVLGEETLDR